ncbi:uncharacterized protein LOC136086774 isoform X2 [Hydra vulgaris]|uniref:Uncharacterized protein LOC136086774 isoform X2 n=1 Tax=Hydra vulgaris TaxID=6087 RepID=A0ABM4CTR2_HYDVU
MKMLLRILLRKISGIQLKDLVKNIMESMMSYKVMSAFNMKGKNRNEYVRHRKVDKTEKQSFQQLKLHELIVTLVMSLKENTLNEINFEIQKILRYAPDKVNVEDGGRKQN